MPSSGAPYAGRGGAPVDRGFRVVDDAGVPTPQQGAAMTVEVRLGAGLGAGRRTMRLGPTATVGDLVAALGPELGVDPGRLTGVAVAVRGEVVGRDRPLCDGESVVVVLPVAGG
jgi:sulfur carrier protein ThiS